MVELTRRIDHLKSPERKRVPFSWRNSVIYQVYPDAFIDPRANLEGENLFQLLNKRLTYFQQLGVDALWFNPVYFSSGVDGGYDITNYKAIDPRYGSLGEFKDFVKRAQDEFGIRIVMDFVGSHTSTQHPWFEEARKSKENYYHDFYVFHNPLSGGLPPSSEQTEWHEPLWQYNAPTDEYYLTSFSPKQADLNWRSPKVREAMWDILRFWSEEVGVDGFRLDVINFYDKDDSYYDSNSPVPVGVNFRRDGPGVYDALLFIRSIVGDDKVLLGEVSVDETKYPYVPVDVMKHYMDVGANIVPQSLPEFSKREWSVPSYREFFSQLYASIPSDATPGFSFSSHDTAERTFSKLGKERAEQLKVMLYLQRGLVVNYYGEEIGMESQFVDPQKRRDVVGRDQQRGPMEWDKAEREIHDSHSPFALTRRLIQLKHSSSALRNGVYEDILIPGFEDTVFAYKWVSGDETLMVINNFTNMDIIGIAAQEGVKGRQVLTSKMDKEEGIRDLSRLSLRPYESIVIQI